MSYRIFVRHGQTELNVTNETRRIFNGQADTPLTEMGRVQPLEAGKQIAAMEDVRLKLAVSSDLSRAVHTAESVLAQLSYHVPLRISKKLRERSLGVFENRFADEVFQEYPEYRDDPQLKEFTMHFTQKAPGGENLTEVTARAWEALQEYERQCDGDMAFFSHYTTIRCLLGKILALSEEQIMKLHIHNAAPIVVKKTEDGYSLVSGLVISPDDAA